MYYIFKFKQSSYFNYWDWIMGTEKDFVKYIEEKDRKKQLLQKEKKLKQKLT